MHTVIEVIVGIIIHGTVVSDDFRYNTSGSGNREKVVKGKVDIKKFGSEDQKRFRRQINHSKFTIACLIHMMYEDDGKLDFLERKEIKKTFKQKKYIMEETDIKEVKEFMKNIPSVNQLVLFGNKYGINSEEYNRTIGLLEIISQTNHLYKPIINRIKQRFIQQKEYMY